MRIEDALRAGWSVDATEVVDRSGDPPWDEENLVVCVTVRRNLPRASIVGRGRAKVFSAALREAIEHGEMERRSWS